MSIQEAKKIYDSLKSTGDLKEFYTNMTGDWVRDRKLFLTQYTSNEELINAFEDGEAQE